MFSTKQLLGISGILVGALIALGVTNKVKRQSLIHWSDRNLTWNDFPEINYIDGNYDAQVYSDITYFWHKEKANLSIHAFMNPNLSKLVSSIDTTNSEELLAHEQYHFNITEYCARLFRKEVAKLNVNNITEHTLNRLASKYSRKCDSLQYKYDYESDHSLVIDKQRYWELHIDALLRNTAYFKDENLYNYQSFTLDSTSYYRSIYKTITGKIYLKHPESKSHSQFGGVYKIQKNKDSLILSYFKNNKPHKDPYFETPITVITYPEPGAVKIEYFDAQNNYNTKLPFCRNIITKLSDGSLVTTFLNAQGEPASNNGVYKIERAYRANTESYYATYYDTKNKLTLNSGHANHEERYLDSLERTISFSVYNKKGEPILDKDLIHQHVYEIDENHKITRVKFFKENKVFAFHVDSYHNKRQYDQRGNLTEIESLDAFSNTAADTSSISKYRYEYDEFSNLTDIYRYNHRNEPVLGDENYHQQVTLYTAEGKMKFFARYYPGYVLHFSDQRWGATMYEYENDTTYTISNVDGYNIPFNNDAGIGKIINYTDHNNNLIREEYFDINNLPAKTNDSITVYTYAYDDNKKMTRVSTYDWLNNLKPKLQDVATTKWKYDVHGNKIETSYYNVNHELANASDSVTFNIYRYNKNHNLIERQNLDKNRKPKELNGIYRTTITINRFGKDSIISNYNASGSLCAEIPITKYYYNDYGTLIEKKYFNKYRKPTTNEEEVHGIRFQYDKYQRNTGYINIGINNQVINDIYGVAQEKRELTKSGYISSEKYFDKENQKTAGPQGYHKAIYVWNNHDEITRFTSFDSQGNKWEDDEGIADYLFEKAPSGISFRISLYDDKGELTEDENGVAEYTYTPSLNGLYYTEKELDANGNEVKDKFDFNTDAEQEEN